MRDAGRHRLGVLVTHPVQYFAPLFREVARDPRVDLTVYYAHRPTPQEQGLGFGVAFTWDIDLTDGYRSVQLENRARTPGAGFLGYSTPQIAGILERERYDAFVVSGWHALTYWQAMQACWRQGTPVLVRGDSQLTVQGAARRWTKDAVYPLFMRRFASCMAVGTRSREYFEHYGARRIDLVPHFVDNERFAARADASRAAAAQLRSRYAIPADATVALFAGKFVDVKRPMDAMRAMAHCGENVHLLMVGDGVLRAVCERESRAAGIAHRVHFAGFMNQSEMPTAYAAADVLVLPSRQETWGLVVNEAMACGLPAIVSHAVGCAPDLILDGRTGHTFPSGDVQALGRRLDALARQPERLVAVKAAARCHIAAWSVAAASTSFIDASMQVALEAVRRAA